MARHKDAPRADRTLTAQAAAAPAVGPGAGMAAEAAEIKPVSLGREAVRRFRANSLAVLSLLRPAHPGAGWRCWPTCCP